MLLSYSFGIIIFFMFLKRWTFAMWNANSKKLSISWHADDRSHLVLIRTLVWWRHHLFAKSPKLKCLRFKNWAVPWKWTDNRIAWCIFHGLILWAKIGNSSKEYSGKSTEKFRSTTVAWYDKSMNVLIWIPSFVIFNRFGARKMYLAVFFGCENGRVAN